MNEKIKPWEDRCVTLKILDLNPRHQPLWIKAGPPTPEHMALPGGHSKGVMPAIDKATGEVKTLSVSREVLGKLREWAEKLRVIDERSSETRRLMSHQQYDHERFKAKRRRIRALDSWWRREPDRIKNRTANRR